MSLSMRWKYVHFWYFFSRLYTWQGLEVFTYCGESRITHNMPFQPRVLQNVKSDGAWDFTEEFCHVEAISESASVEHDLLHVTMWQWYWIALLDDKFLNLRLVPLYPCACVGLCRSIYKGLSKMYFSFVCLKKGALLCWYVRPMQGYFTRHIWMCARICV